MVWQLRKMRERSFVTPPESQTLVEDKQDIHAFTTTPAFQATEPSVTSTSPVQGIEKQSAQVSPLELKAERYSDSYPESTSDVVMQEASTECKPTLQTDGTFDKVQENTPMAGSDVRIDFVTDDVLSNVQPEEEPFYERAVSCGVWCGQAKPKTCPSKQADAPVGLGDDENECCFPPRTARAAPSS